MKILIITHYYWPENFKINEISKHLSNKVEAVSILTGKLITPQGHIIKVITFITKTRKINDINIYRAPVVTRGSGSSIRLVVNWISFAFSLF